MTSDADDYFVNHFRSRRFPWSLYHRPIERDLEAFLCELARETPEARVLVIGCGLMHELDRIPERFRLTLVDADPRVVDEVRKRSDPRIASAVCVAEEAGLATVGVDFDAAYAKEVIEHVPAWREFLQAIRQVLRPSGRLWLSTPNYGEPWMPLLEYTVLELIARWSGYSRFGIHPSRFSRASLRQALVEAGFREIRVQPVAFRLALTAHARP